MADVKRVLRSKDFIAGLFFLAFGTVSFLLGRDYTMGTARNMGPGYFPTFLALILSLVGIITMAKAVLRPGEAIETPAFSKLALITFSVVLFALVLRPLGLAAAIFLLVMVSAYTSKKFKVIPSLVLAICMAAGSSIVFVKLLGVPIPIIGTWLGGR